MKWEVHTVLRFISMIDLLSFPDSKKIVMEGNEDALNELLHDIGFDISKDIDYEECLHRPMSYIAADKSPVSGWRIVGTERCDAQWMMSGYATMENRLEKVGARDVTLLRELLGMSKEGNFTQMLIDDMKENSRTTNGK